MKATPMSRLSRETGGLQNFLVGTGLIAIGGCLGILLGSLLDAPRLVMSRFYKPVQTVQLELAEEAEPTNALELSEYRALQEKQKPIPKVALPDAPEKPVAKAEPSKPATPPLPVVSATRLATHSTDKPEPIERPAEPESGTTKEALIASIKQTTPHPVPELALVPDPTPKPRSKPESALRPKPEAAPEAGRSQLVVQVAAYADVPTALRLVSELQQSGFDAYVSPRAAAGPYPHRVRVRPGGSQRVADLAQRLKGEGYSVWTTRE